MYTYTDICLHIRNMYNTCWRQVQQKKRASKSPFDCAYILFVKVLYIIFFVVFPECVAKGSRLTLRVWG